MLLSLSGDDASCQQIHWNENQFVMTISTTGICRARRRKTYHGNGIFNWIRLHWNGSKKQQQKDVHTTTTTRSFFVRRSIYRLKSNRKLSRFDWSETVYQVIHTHTHARARHLNLHFHDSNATYIFTFRHRFLLARISNCLTASPSRPFPHCTRCERGCACANAYMLLGSTAYCVIFAFVQRRIEEEIIIDIMYFIGLSWWCANLCDDSGISDETLLSITYARSHAQILIS